ncbi:hypothetical protein QI210_10215 [Staphylococcus saprophyticus]|nr:hypothetical protein [Staphylococcus saprophyticus]
MNRWVGLSVTFDCVVTSNLSARDSNHDNFYLRQRYANEMA